MSLCTVVGLTVKPNVPGTLEYVYVVLGYWPTVACSSRPAALLLFLVLLLQLLRCALTLSHLLHSLILKLLLISLLVRPFHRAPLIIIACSVVNFHAKVGRVLAVQRLEQRSRGRVVVLLVQRFQLRLRCLSFRRELENKNVPFG
jgi:hypothetical protein